MSRNPVTSHPLPSDALLAAYRDSGAYTDCFMTRVRRTVALPEYIQSFYSTWLFGLERFILKWAVSKPSSTDDIRRLSTGDTKNFAAWSVESRRDDELLMADFRGHTRSWLKCQPAPETGETELLFGSAVVSQEQRKALGQGRPDLYGVLMPVHRAYSVALLSCARRRLERT